MRRSATCLLAGIALAAIAWFRLDAMTRETIWAEDGRDFLAGALDGKSVFTPYDGYVHVVPRILADVIVQLVPVSQFATAMTALTIAVAAGIGLLVFGLAVSLGISRGARAGLALLTVLAPALTTEVSGNAANLHWLFLWLSPWLLLARPTTWVRSVLLGVVACAAATTEIQMLLFMPLLLVGYRDRLRWPLGVGALLGASAQVLAFLASDRTGPADHPSVLSTVHGYALQVGGGAWMGPIGSLVEQVFEHGWWVAYATLLAFVLAAIWLLVTAPHLRIVVAALIVGSVTCWAAGYLLNLGAWADYAGSAPEQMRLIGTLRHAVVPSMFLLAIAVLAVDRLLSRPGTGGIAWVGRGIGAALAVSLVVAIAMSADGRGESLRSTGPSWSASVAEARGSCEQAPETKKIAISTAPPAAQWSLSLSCERLLADRDRESRSR